jgi:hypothetical protein
MLWHDRPPSHLCIVADDARASLSAIAELLDHRGVRMTTRYAQLSPAY